jgi:hypothetical protein
VHLPDTGSQTQDAIYAVHTGGGGVQNRALNVHVDANTWASVGVFHFTPSSSDYQGVSLSNFTPDGAGNDDISWDATAFQPLSAKPADFVVQMGDSYSSGTGAGDYEYGSVTGPYASLDSKSSGPTWNACLRSKNSWARKADLPGTSTSIGARADAFDDTLDYHSVACNGALTYEVDPAADPSDSVGDSGHLGIYHEVPQLDSGFLDDDTTLVALTIGGNGADFSGTITNCIELDCPSDATVERQIDTAVDRTRTVLNDIHAKAKNAQIILMGYPELFDIDAPTCTSIVNGGAQVKLNGWADYLSNAEQQMATAAATDGTDPIPVTYRSPTGDFDGARICDASAGLNDYVAGPADGNLADFSCPSSPLPCPSMESYHPNKTGTTRYTGTFQIAMAESGYDATASAAKRESRAPRAPRSGDSVRQ